MSRYKADKKDNVLILKKSLEKLTKENAELAQKLDYITKEEILDAIKKIAKEVGVEINFTFDKLKNKIK